MKKIVDKKTISATKFGRQSKIFAKLKLLTAAGTASCSNKICAKIGGKSKKFFAKKIAQKPKIGSKKIFRKMIKKSQKNKFLKISEKIFF